MTTPGWVSQSSSNSFTTGLLIGCVLAIPASILAIVGFFIYVVTANTEPFLTIYGVLSIIKDAAFYLGAFLLVTIFFLKKWPALNTNQKIIAVALLGLAFLMLSTTLEDHPQWALGLIVIGFTLIVGALAVQLFRWFNAPPHFSAIAGLIKNQKYAEALPLLNESIQRQPHRWETHYLRAGVYNALIDWAAAEQDARTGITLWPDKSEFYEILASLLIQQSRYTEAISQLEPLINKWPYNGNLPAFIGKAYYRLGNYADSAKWSDLAQQKALQPRVRNLTANYYLASSLEKLGQLDPAHQVYQRMAAYKQIAPELEIYSNSSTTEGNLMATDIAEIKRRLGITQAEPS
jgi:hypothetical protein